MTAGQGPVYPEYPLPKPLGSLAPPGIFETHGIRTLPPPPKHTFPAPATNFADSAGTASAARSLLPAPKLVPGDAMKYR
eukprot:CAMPEP_0181299104 /NCGR_PEP_ID=MMETSP1101-20121128/6156_1 /TAXON_ID=46948 /ORGANISM="Rhodomonas abbreviata, Strain Caron Lab Isolate" /LENGTH=78 /DNA_ID=CAMNT_0023404207 /DNA_START=128 /DNA_END=364 /DNA_ORIENTATION=+